MNVISALSIRNLLRRPARTAALALLSALLSCSVFGGSLAVLSLRRGLASYEARLGADVVVVPNQARSHGTLESILLQGIPGSFYMDAACLDKIRALEGVEAASPQFFLASASAGCCSVAVQLTGFDPETDFSIQPWIRERYAGAIRDGELLVGSGITVPRNRELTFYGVTCPVAAQLERTGTGLDHAIYASMNTIRTMIQSARDLGFHIFDGVEPEAAISSVLIRVREGYSPESVASGVNLHLRRVTATPSKNMIAGIAGGLSGVSRVIGVLMVLVWVLAAGILAAAFAMIARERLGEFAVLRAVGASGRTVARLLLAESALTGLMGGVVGAAAAAATVLPFSGLIRLRLSLPYLLPEAGTIAALFGAAVILTAAAGALSAALTARRMGRREPGLLLRQDA